MIVVVSSVLVIVDVTVIIGSCFDVYHYGGTSYIINSSEPYAIN